MLRGALDYLNRADAPGLGAATQAEALIGLERAVAMHTAARAKILAAFTASRGFEADGQYGPCPWLRARTKVTKTQAAVTAAWARRLDAHPAVAEALAAGAISVSWARQLCDWTDPLPGDARAAAEAIRLAAAAGGADLPDLAVLAREIRERCATCGPGKDTGTFADRMLHLDKTLDGAGSLHGDLTPACAAALSAVLDALSGKTGPEDTRPLAQRRHDALEEACQRLIQARMVPGRDGQPIHLLAHIDLAALRTFPGAAGLEAEWAHAQTGQPGTAQTPSPADGPGSADGPGTGVPPQTT